MEKNGGNVWGHDKYEIFLVLFRSRDFLNKKHGAWVKAGNK